MHLGSVTTKRLMGTKVARRAAAPGSGPEQAQPARATDEKEKTRTPRRSKTAPKEEEAAEVTAQVAAAAALENPLPRSACGGSFSKKAPVFSTDGRYATHSVALPGFRGRH